MNMYSIQFKTRDLDEMTSSFIRGVLCLKFSETSFFSDVTFVDTENCVKVESITVLIYLAMGSILNTLEKSRIYFRKIHLNTLLQK